MPVPFTPDLIPRYDKTFLSYINTNMQRLKQSLQGIAIETIATTAPTSPYSGQKYTNLTLGIDYVYNGTVWVPVSHWGPGTLHSPTWTQSGAISRTITYSNYFKEGRKVKGSMALAATSAGLINTIQTVTSPVAPSVAGNRSVGAGHYYDASLNANVPILVYLASSTTFAFIVSSSIQGPSLGQAGSGHAEAVASGDSITFFYDYESTS